MSFSNRVNLLKNLEKIRGSNVICYLTSVRPNVMSVISSDAVRVLYDHLLLLPSKPVPKLDFFVCSNGGDGTVSWRLVSLLREFSETFNVILPYRAYSAATMIALGADEIVMHPLAEMGPIDPTVSNEFNPMDQMGRRLGISVEDVKAYINFIKSTVGITHEDELIEAIKILADKVHPLALGNVERFLAQSRMIAAKILRTHMKEDSEHTIHDIIENMASKLYFHGHPINRREAKQDLRLKIAENLPPETETTIWDLYKDFEKEFKNDEAFNPHGDLAAMPPPAAVPPNPPTPKSKEYDLLHAIVESPRLSSQYVTKRRFTQISLQQPGQLAVQEEIISQAWSHSAAPAAQ